MSGEKKLWRLPTPFQGLSGKQHHLPPKAKVGHLHSRVSSVYLSDDSSTNGFVIVPEFDDPGQTDTTYAAFNYTPRLPAVTCSGTFPSGGVDGYPYDSESMGSQSLDRASCDISVINASQDDDLTKRLGSAYEHIRSMSSAASPKVILSSDPQMLRKQLGVPQHSVLNYPITSAPNLPNPYTVPRVHTFPRLPPTTLPNVPHGGGSKNLGLRRNTNVYPPPSRNCSSDPSQHAQRKSVIIAPTPPESSSECNTLGDSWNMNIAGTSKSQSFITNSSKLAKRRINDLIVSPSSLSTFRRRALKDGLRKRAADTPSSKNVLRWQKSLPQIRSPSPFRVDIPLHHTWHERRTEFDSPLEYQVQLNEAKLRRTNRSTNVLASLAWIGTSPMAPSFYIADKERHSMDAALLSDRLSMAIAVEDDNISDDVLMDQLEKARKMGNPSDPLRGTLPRRPSSDTLYRSIKASEDGVCRAFRSSPSPPVSDQSPTPCDISLSCSLLSGDTISDLDDAEIWRAARKALLCVREIVRTEKKYQEALKMLLNAQTATPPPPSMTPYVSSLFRASEMLLKYFLEDPSAWGVSTAFVTSEDELEATMVSWCAIAGGYFTDGNDPQSGGSTGKWRLRKSGMMSSFSSPVTKQTSNPPSPQLPPMLTMTYAAGKIEERCAGQNPQNEQERKTNFVSLWNAESTSNQTSFGQPPGRKLSVRDLAIQPIQRVMRYVLLYKDLLDCTPPTSPSRLLVERALEAATRIASHCDRAQRNPAFHHAP